VVTDEPAREFFRACPICAWCNCKTGKFNSLPWGTQRARDIVPASPLGERLFKDTFSIDDSEARTQACKFEHIISPELTSASARSSGTPRPARTGIPSPRAKCCNGKSRFDRAPETMPTPLDPKKTNER